MFGIQYTVNTNTMNELIYMPVVAMKRFDLFESNRIIVELKLTFKEKN